MFPVLGFFHGEDCLNAAEEVAGHPVSTAYVEARPLTRVLKVVNPRMLEIAAKDRANSDILAEAFDSGDNSADSADDQIDLYTGFGGFVEGFDGFLVDQTVHLDDDTGWFSSLRIGRFLPNESLDRRVEVEWSDQEVLEVGRAGESSQRVEQIRDFFRDVGFGCKVGVVRVEARRLGIVVPRSHMNEATECVVGFTPYDKTSFAVSL